MGLAESGFSQPKIAFRRLGEGRFGRADRRKDQGVGTWEHEQRNKAKISLPGESESSTADGIKEVGLVSLII
jgi:hypothetical protein